MDNFREEESTKLMTHIRAKKLDFRANLVPIIREDVPDVGVQSFIYQRICADSSIAGGKRIILFVAFIKDASVSSINHKWSS